MNSLVKIVILLGVFGLVAGVFVYRVQQRNAIQSEKVHEKEIVMSDKVELNIKGMACSNCVRNVKRALSEVPSVKGVDVDLKNGKAVVHVEENKVTVKQLLTAVEDAGFQATVINPALRDDVMVKEKVISVLALFTSTGTLICCALPAALAAVAGGAAVASLVSTFPWLVTISQYKEWIFVIAGLLIVFTALITSFPKGKLACSITGGKGCEVAGKFQKTMLWISIAIYAVGAFMAYGYVYLLEIIQE